MKAERGERGWKPGMIFWLGLMVSWLPWSAGGQEDFFIIVPQKPTLLRVGVPEAGMLSRLPPGDQSAAKLTQLMREAVAMTGLFDLIPPDAYPPPMQAGKENMPVWKLINADYVIRMDVSALDSRRYQVEFRCFDVRMDKMVIGKRYTGEKELFGRMVFRFIDELMEFLTGERSSLEGRIAYVSNVTGRDEIRVMDLDGANDQAITSNRTINVSPAWSPDGTKIVYTDYRERNPDLYIADIAQGVNYKLFGSRSLNISPEFSPRGDVVAFAHEAEDGNIDIYFLAWGSKSLKRITTSSANDLSPTFSPDGRMIAFVSDRTGVPQIYLLNVAAGSEGPGNPAITLTHEGPYNTSPAWSPDGKYIVYTGRVGGQFDLFLIDMTDPGRSIRRLTATPVNEENPSWSPDSRFLVYDSTQTGNGDIYVMSIFGGTPKLLTKSPAKERMPAWSPTFGE